MIKRIIYKWLIALKILPLILIVAALKFCTHKFGFEVMELNGLFTSLVAGTIFLIGFLISGVLSDYKESEKLPTEIAAALRNLYDDALAIYEVKNSVAAKRILRFQRELISTLNDWFYKKVKMKVLLDKLSSMNTFYIALDKEGIQANYIIKMKNEQNNIRKMVMRIDTIRDTEFVGSAYAIVEAMGFLTVVGLLIIKIEPYYASLFMTLLITFLISYMFLLIKDLDNPFDYLVNGETGTEISLKPIHDFEKMVSESKYCSD
jgi:hypothetical protein